MFARAANMPDEPYDVFDHHVEMLERTTLLPDPQSVVRTWRNW